MLKIAESEKNEELSVVEEIALKWQYEMFGTFFMTLMKAVSLADQDNLSRLETGFPDHVSAYRCYSSIPGWWEGVRQKALRCGYFQPF